VPGDGSLFAEASRVQQLVDPLAHGEATALALTGHRLGAAELRRPPPSLLDSVDFGLPAHDSSPVNGSSSSGSEHP
jgi:hypothetical protein